MTKVKYAYKSFLKSHCGSLSKMEVHCKKLKPTSHDCYCYLWPCHHLIVSFGSFKFYLYFPNQNSSVQINGPQRKICTAPNMAQDLCGTVKVNLT